MSASQNTTNYGFPKFLGTDKPAWLVDFNGAMDDIDSTIKTTNDLLTSVSGTVDTNTSDINQTITDLESLTGVVASKSPIENPEFLGNITLNGVTLTNIMYPIGSIYISTISTNPSLFFGGVWQAFGAGKTLVGIDITQTEFNTIEKTGGEKTHQLSIDEMPTHNHLYANYLGLNSGGTIESNYVAGANISSGVTTASNAHLKGGNIGHNNLQPYIVTYMWKRMS